MDIYKLNFTVLEQEIFSLLCLRAGERLSQREIAIILKVSPTAVSNSIHKLKDNNLIKLEKTKTINFISFNCDEQRARELKRVENLKNIYLSGLSDYLEEVLPGGTIMLFGSYCRGEDSNTSDIDIDTSVTDYVTVRITYDYRHLFSLDFFGSAFGISTTTTITGKTTMRSE